jgi:hypothetical protein
MDPIPVVDGTATLTIPPDMKPRRLRVGDSGSVVKIDVTEPDKK